jgi:arylsulfatase A-like enzyme
MFGAPEKAPGICSEAVCRVPMIWRVPGLTAKGHLSGELVENVDIAATLPALCGLPPMETTDGCDIRPLLEGIPEPVREVAVTENVWSKALRWGRWRFVHYQPEMFAGFRTLDGTTLGAQNDIGELYDLEADPLETRNLYHNPAHRETVECCRRLLLEWLIRTSRVASIWPAPQQSPIRYDTAADGLESSRAGARQRRDAGQVWYL